MPTTKETDSNHERLEQIMVTLQETIGYLNSIKHGLLDQAWETDSEHTRQLSLHAAVDLHRVQMRLHKILQTLVPFKLAPIETDPTPPQRAMLSSIRKKLKKGVTL